MEQKKLIFKDRYSKEFYPVVKARVNKYFEDNKISIHGDYRMVLKTIILMGSFFGAYALLFTGWVNIWGMLGLCVVLGFCTAGLGFSVAHDAIHGSYTSNNKVNYVIGLTMNLIGGNRYMWSITHNIIHHTYTNIDEFDEDLEIAPGLVRLTKHQKHNPMHRIQAYSAFLLYGLACLFWVMVKDYKKFLQKDLGPYLNKKHPKSEWVMLFITKAIYYSYIIVIPLTFLPITWWQFLIGFIVMQLVAGIILGVVFQLAHIVEDLEFPKPEDAGHIENNWAVHQMYTTANFAMKNKFINWYVGGLNFQVEHHLFPRICHIHYPEISKILQKTAEEYHVPYNYNETFFGAVASHIRTLKKYSKPNPKEENNPMEVKVA